MTESSDFHADFHALVRAGKSHWSHRKNFVKSVPNVSGSYAQVKTPALRTVGNIVTGDDQQTQVPCMHVYSLESQIFRLQEYVHPNEFHFCKLSKGAACIHTYRNVFVFVCMQEGRHSWFYQLAPSQMTWHDSNAFGVNDISLSMEHEIKHWD
jgi:hypothetical protein